MMPPENAILERRLGAPGKIAVLLRAALRSVPRRQLSQSQNLSQSMEGVLPPALSRIDLRVEEAGPILAARTCYGSERRSELRRPDGGGMDILERFLTLLDAERWGEALPLIEHITARGSDDPASWFNYGVCLAALGRHGEAAERFMKAYELRPEDHGAQYRVFRSLYDAGDCDRLLAFARRECQAMPELIQSLQDDEQFSTLFSRPEFRKLVDELAGR
jgi:tetratricopeptide (TPR) repeat protein